MPIYEYKCQSCGERLERLVRSEDDVPVACPSCGQSDLKKQFSSFSALAAAPKCSGDSCPSVAKCPATAGCAGGACPF